MDNTLSLDVQLQFMRPGRLEAAGGCRRGRTRGLCAAPY